MNIYIRIIILILIILSKPFLVMASERLVYRCKLSNGSVGYYDLPCEYLTSNNAILGEKLVVEEKALLFTFYSKKNRSYNNGDHIYTSHNRLQDLQIFPIITKEVANKYTDINNIETKDLIKDKLSIKRCNKATDQIAIIEDLLKNQYINQNRNYEQALARAKRSLARYQKIKKKYCIELG